MKKEPQIFTQINRKNEPVNLDILVSLEEEALSERLIRSYVKETLYESRVEFSGILKLMPDENVISQIKDLLTGLPPTAIPTREDKWHVTLVHQSILKPFRKELKQMAKEGLLPEPPEIIIDRVIDHRIEISPETEKQSWVVWIENQTELSSYVNQVMEIVGAPSNPEPTRVFHISIANLTGKPGDSVR